MRPVFGMKQAKGVLSMTKRKAPSGLSSVSFEASKSSPEYDLKVLGWLVSSRRGASNVTP
jgi:hypothetical protein